MSTYKPSYYNMRVAHDGGFLLFNGETGALMRLDSEVAEEWAPYLGPERSARAGAGYSEWKPAPFTLDAAPASLVNQFELLLDAGIFVPGDMDERARLKEEFLSGQSKGPFWVTVTTTLDCNMRCYYCYQKDDELDHMSRETADEVIEWLRARIDTGEHRKLYLEWYGGEPMLNREVIEHVSREIVPYCDRRGIPYKASMICNGTNWPEDVDRFLAETRLFRVQFSLDGPQRFHDKRRGTIRPAGMRGRDASYDEVMTTVGSVIGKASVYLRINVDPWIGDSCLELIDECSRRGWLEPGNRFFPYIALINPMTEHCGFIGNAVQFQDFRPEFNRIQNEFTERLSQESGDASAVLEKIMYFPNRRIINCAAVNKNAVVFGPNGLMYKCGLDVGDDFRAHDALGTGKPAQLQAQTHLRTDRWDKYDPFTHESCKECQYLPVCLGGCPRTHMEGEQAKIKANSEFFEKNFDTMIRQYYDSMDRM